MNDDAAPPNAHLAGADNKRKHIKRRQRAAVARGMTRPLPSIIALRLIDERPLDAIGFGANLFASQHEADAFIRTAPNGHLICSRAFAHLPDAIRWAKGTKHSVPPLAQDAASSTLVGHTWISPYLLRHEPSNLEDPSDEGTLMVEVESDRNFMAGRELIGFDAWIDGEKQLSELSELAATTPQRAVLEGCIKALRHISHKTPRIIYLSSSSPLPYLAVTESYDEMPRKCKRLAQRLRAACLALPTVVSIGPPRD